jgi:hypothetical protein
MKNQIAQIGVITYKNYTENVIIDNNFDTQALYDIMDNDSEFVRFHIVGKEDKFITGTVTVSKNIEIIGTTYNAFAKNPMTHKTKTTWVLSTGGYLTSKKDAEASAEYQNKKNRRLIENAKN